MKVQLENDIPLPVRAVSAEEQFDFKNMKVGQSFAVDDEKQLKRARNAAMAYKKKTPGWDYTTEKYKDGSGRMWRQA